MSRCGSCGSGKNPCTCIFEDTATAITSGNGQSYAPVNFRPTNVPKPRPYGHLTRRASDQVIAANTTVAVTFDNVDETPFANGMINLATFPTRLTAPVDGFYLAYGFIRPNNINDILWIRRTGSITGVMNLESQITPSVGGQSVMTMIDMRANEYLELMVTTHSFNGITIVRTDATFIFADAFPHFWAEWVRGL